MRLPVEEYLENFDFKSFLKSVKVRDERLILDQIRYFTVKEAVERDRIVESYFGSEKISEIVDILVNKFKFSPIKHGKIRTLDLGSGTGFFTVRVAEKLRKLAPDLEVYAMDATPSMLKVLVNKYKKVTPIIGVAEDVRGSLNFSSGFMDLPSEFEFTFSILTLHHCLNVANVFRSVSEVLGSNGLFVVVDLCKHEFEEFKLEMGDVHLGFNPEEIREIAKETFSEVKIEIEPGIKCECSGRGAEIFFASMIK